MASGEPGTMTFSKLSRFFVTPLAIGGSADHPHKHEEARMKKPGCILHTMMLSMFVLLAVAIWNGQYENQILEMKNTFDFSIGKPSFPAGEYTFEPSLQH